MFQTLAVRIVIYIQRAPLDGDSLHEEGKNADSWADDRTGMMDAATKSAISSKAP
jgi:hypothetical protein